MQSSDDTSATGKAGDDNSPDSGDLHVTMKQEEHNETSIEHQDQLPAKAQAAAANQGVIIHLPEDDPFQGPSVDPILVQESQAQGSFDENNGIDESPSKEYNSRHIEINLPKVVSAVITKASKPPLTERRKSLRDAATPGPKPKPPITRAMSGGASREDSTKKKGESGPRSRAAAAAAAQNISTADPSKTDAKKQPKGGNIADAEGTGEDEAYKKLHGDLIAAIKKGDTAMLRNLISTNPDSLDAKFGKLQESPLLLALRNGDNSIPLLVETILSFDPNVNARDIHGRTALMSASGRGLLETTELLLGHGASINAQDRLKESALYDAVWKRREQVVKLLLNSDANPNLANNIGRTPLHVAAWRGWHEMIELLLLVDTVDVNPKDIRSGHTPLHDACSRGHERIVKTLLESGADVNAKSSKNLTPLHIAAKNGNADIVKDLLQAGADTMLYTQNLNTPETLVPKTDENGIVELLKRKDLAGSGTTHRTGKDLNVSKPSPRQEDICKHFEGFIWPSVDRTYRYDNLTVWDMLYSESPKLKNLKARSAPVWIHLPANVKDWVQDIFKLIYSTGKENAKGKDKATSEGSPTNQNSDATLRNILQFLDSHFGEVGRQEYTCFRQSHYKVPHSITTLVALEKLTGRLLSVRCRTEAEAADLRQSYDICGDMQQPYYYMKDEDKQAKDDETDDESDSEERAVSEDSDHKMSPSRERRLVKKYATSEGRSLNKEEKAHVKYMWDLTRAYDGNVHLSRTLDESFYELLDFYDLNHRDGDQVLSRFLGRFRLDVEGVEKEGSEDDQKNEDNEDDDDEVDEDAAEDENGSCVNGTRPPSIDQDETQEQENIDTAIDTSKHATTPAVKRKSTGDRKQDQNAPLVANNLGRTESVTKDAQDLGKVPSPSELENQVKQAHRLQRKWLANIVSKLKRHKEPIENPESGTESETNDGNSVSDAGSDTEDTDDEDDGEDSKRKRPRQQILIVPQLWIWKVENIIVTAFPDRWDNSNPRALPKIMLASVEERNKAAKKEKMLEDMDVQGVLHSVIDSCLGFEPWFSAYDEDRGYHDAFAAEIAHVSSQTTACYVRYRESLGKAEESFATAMKEETELLMMTDDILSEIAMIERVQEDQSQVCIEMAAEEDTITQSNKKDLGASPWLSPKSPTRHRMTPRSVTDDSQLESMSFQDIHRNRPAPLPRPNTKLARLEEDARRVRKSIITLLDLRQRQASTENAINSGKQSQILFEQSKVLFIFTGATVIFAPLSWVSSLLALKIESFTPDAWRIDQAFGASFGSLMGTLLLCFVFWKVYDYYFSDTDDSKANKNSWNWLRRLSWRRLLRRSSRKSSNGGGSTSGSTHTLVTGSGSRSSLEEMK